MTCLEAQSKIMAFIEGKLPDDELKEFIKHVRNCDNCSEELEIYYTLIVGMKQLDNEENLSTNFKNELNTKMNEEMTRMTAVKRIATSTIVVVLAAIVACFVWIYSGILDKVYNYEQHAKLETQTEFFYSDTFGNELFYNNDYMTSILEARLNQNEEENNSPLEKNMDFIYKVKKYNATHKTYIEVAEEAVEKEIDENEEITDY
jgi:hypothetical protein